ncbi:SET domain-containing protein [Candidatus Woesearchaeota archaeon]|nr:SET domain-containing protein [Candidatus Woesearchaeota archaeon]
MSSVIVKDSKIQGRGVFADKDFKKGDIVMKWDASMILTEKEAKKIPARYKKYLVFFKGKYIMAQYPEKYLNHSCEPNTKEGNLCDIAIRDIKKGEELTTDYSINSPPQLKMKCNCKSKKCRKII